MLADDTRIDQLSLAVFWFLHSITEYMATHILEGTSLTDAA